MKHFVPPSDRLLTDDELKARLRARLAAFPPHVGKALMARELGVSEGVLSRLVRGSLPIGPEIAAKLGFRPVTRFERIS